MFLVGLTGGIASGKSTVSSMLKDKGAFIIDADIIGHEVIRKGREGYQALVSEFGPGILGEDGEIDRGRLASAVFGDPGRVTRLNAITHPLIGKEIFNRLNRFREQNAEGGIAVLDAALLVESGGKDLVDMLVVVAAPLEVQMERLKRDRGMEEEEAHRRIRAQSSLEEKMAQADWVVMNEGTLQQLELEVERLWEEIERRASHKCGDKAGTKSTEEED